MFAFVYSIDPLQLQGQRNNDIVVRGSLDGNTDKISMPQEGIVNENLNFQMVKFVNKEKQGISISENQTLYLGDKVLIRIIPFKDMEVSFLLKNKTITSIIKENFMLKKGKEISLPESIISSQTTFEVEGPAGKESFLIKDKDNRIFFKFNYEVR